MTERATLRCVVCGGGHRPTSAMHCDEDGMEREAARMGAKRWNQITGEAMRQINRRAHGEKDDPSR